MNILLGLFPCEQGVPRGNKDATLEKTPSGMTWKEGIMAVITTVFCGITP